MGLIWASFALLAFSACQIPSSELVGSDTWSIVGPAIYPDLDESQAWAVDKVMHYDGQQYWQLLTKLEGGKEFKFRKGAKWLSQGGDQLGGNLWSLRSDGGNIKVPATGLYLLKLDPVARFAYLEYRK